MHPCEGLVEFRFVCSEGQFAIAEGGDEAAVEDRHREAFRRPGVVADRTEVSTQPGDVTDTVGEERGDENEVGHPVVVVTLSGLRLRRAECSQSGPGLAAGGGDALPVRLM